MCLLGNKKQPRGGSFIGAVSGGQRPTAALHCRLHLSVRTQLSARLHYGATLSKLCSSTRQCEARYRWPHNCYKRQDCIEAYARGYRGNKYTRCRVYSLLQDEQHFLVGRIFYFLLHPVSFKSINNICVRRSIRVDLREDLHEDQVRGFLSPHVHNATDASAALTRSNLESYSWASGRYLAFYIVSRLASIKTWKFCHNTRQSF